MTSKWVLLILLISLFLSLRNPKRLETETETGEEFSHPIFSVFLQTDVIQDHDHGCSSSSSGHCLEYDFYRDTCPDAEKIVRSRMTRIYSQQQEVSANLLRLFFHDCFIKGCDASVFLDDSSGNKSYPIERQAIPNQTLKGFDKIDLIKQELEEACPGVVSCADTLALATRDGILLAGGPYYPVFTGRRDSIQSYFEEAMAEIPNPDANLTEILHLFSIRGFSLRETVSLLGGHNIGKISCDFITSRLSNFSGTGQPDPTMAVDFGDKMRVSCAVSNNTAESPAPMRSWGTSELTPRMSFQQQESIVLGSSFDTHYYQSLLRGRGPLYADQQLMANEASAKLVRAYASDSGTKFRIDFARVMLKMSNLGVLTGSQGQVRINCSLPFNGS